MPYVHEVGPEIGRRAFDASLYGIRQINDLVATHGIQCDFEENGMLEAAMTDAQAARLEQHQLKQRGAKRGLPLSNDAESDRSRAHRRVLASM